MMFFVYGKWCSDDNRTVRSFYDQREIYRKLGYIFVFQIQVFGVDLKGGPVIDRIYNIPL